MTRILYVEDNDDNVYMLKLRFELLDGFEVLVAEDGEAGCAKAIAENPDLILMDLDLPVVDGWEASRRLKNNPATHDIPIIALTAHAMSGSREKALAAGCDEFDTKPVDFDRLMQKINSLLGAKSQIAKVAQNPRYGLYSMACLRTASTSNLLNSSTSSLVTNWLTSTLVRSSRGWPSTGAAIKFCSRSQPPISCRPYFPDWRGFVTASAAAKNASGYE